MSGATHRLFLIEMEALNPTSGEVETLRFSNRGFNTGRFDVPANAHYAPRLIQPANFQRSLFSSGTTVGRLEVGVGEVILTNMDGGLDYLLADDWGLDGRSLRILTGPAEASYGSLATWLSGTVAQAEFSHTQVRISLRDRMAALDKPIQPATFDGSNSGPSGIEGTETTIQGQVKPMLFGRAFNVTPVLLNDSELIYGVNFDHNGNTAPIASVDAVYDGGDPIDLPPTNVTDYTNLAALQGASPAIDSYDTCLAEGLIKLGGSPIRAVTCDVTEGATAADRTVAAIVQRILEGPAGLATSELDLASFTALDSFNSAEVGIYINSETTILDVVTALTGSIGAWLVPNRGGVFSKGSFAAVSLEPPTGALHFNLAGNSALIAAVM